MVFCADFEAMARAIEQVEASTLFWPMRMKRYVRLARELGHALAAGGGAALAREVDADRDRVTLFLLWPE